MQISILGCGWLGLPLAQSLINKGFLVNGSTTSTEKTEVLKATGIHPFLISLSANGIDGDMDSFLRESEILIIDIPPKLRGENSESFTDKIKNLIPYIEAAEIQKVMFVSSTAVYADDISHSTVTEDTTPNPETESGRQLLEAETLLANARFKTTVLRFGGLVGEDRQPVKYLAGKENLENPDGPVNLIHLEDCIGIIQKIIEKESWGEIFNGVAPYHPTREEHYTKKAAALGLALPVFSHEKPSFGKTVSGDKVEKILGYVFDV
ncbi:SDR family oxidoreductase [Flavobacterium suzhouense]|uniref:SDR family oxidoreductase n=1 Tax=Flavobacterium suzhouense TaxID=1529638 RepID=A0ABW5NUT9_9FLAO